jgi:hypothetical protein
MNPGSFRYNRIGPRAVAGKNQARAAARIRLCAGDRREDEDGVEKISRC